MFYIDELLLNHIHEITNQKNLCYAGGVALNGVANNRILKEGPFENIHIPPSPGDAGSAVGCAQYSYYVHNQQKRIIEQNHSKRVQENVYVGPSYDNKTIQKYEYFIGTVFLLLSVGFVALNMDHGVWYD